MEVVFYLYMQGRVLEDEVHTKAHHDREPDDNESKQDRDAFAMHVGEDTKCGDIGGRSSE